MARAETREFESREFFFRKPGKASQARHSAQLAVKSEVHQSRLAGRRNPGRDSTRALAMNRPLLSADAIPDASQVPPLQCALAACEKMHSKRSAPAAGPWRSDRWFCSAGHRHSCWRIRAAERAYRLQRSAPTVRPVVWRSCAAYCSRRLRRAATTCLSAVRPVVCTVAAVRSTATVRSTTATLRSTTTAVRSTTTVRSTAAVRPTAKLRGSTGTAAATHCVPRVSTGPSAAGAAGRCRDERCTLGLRLNPAAPGSRSAHRWQGNVQPFDNQLDSDHLLELQYRYRHQRETRPRLRCVWCMLLPLLDLSALLLGSVLRERVSRCEAFLSELWRESRDQACLYVARMMHACCKLCCAA